MKSLIFFVLLFLFFSCQILSQNLVMYKATGLIITDTLYFGFDENASMGVDVNLGEVDLNLPENDISTYRVAQRDSINFLCAYRLRDSIGVPDTAYYFNNVFDSKVNYRPFPVTHENKCFEFVMPGVNEDDYYILMDQNGTALNKIIHQTGEHYGGCLEYFTGHSYYSVIPIADAHIVSYNSFTLSHLTNMSICFIEGITTNTNNVIQSDSEVKLYPNPATNDLQFLGLDNKSGHFDVYNPNGVKVMQGKFHGGGSIDVSKLPNGVYFFKIMDSSKKYSWTKIFTKQ